MAAALNTLWRLAASQPQLLAAHAAGYAALLRDEGTLSLRLVQRRALLQVLAFGGVVAGVVLAGVAMMLWASTPDASLARPWVLVVVPLLPLLVAGCALLAARRLGPLPLWAAWQSQVDADSALLRQAAVR